MVALSGIALVLLIIVLVLRILFMTGAAKTVVTITQSTSEPPVAPLPERTPSEIKKISDSMPTDWVTYNGMTPPLRLKIRGQSYESYRRITRTHLDEIGQHNVENLSPNQMNDLNNLIIADAYVVDWEGAQYQNGNSLPYSPENLVVFFNKDPLLLNFVTENAKKIGPAWPAL